MALSPLDVLKLPFWTLALATGAKSFRDNRVIGSPALNRRGLHMRRVKLAHDLAWSRRRRLQHIVSSEDRAAFDRDGFVLKRHFLDRDFSRNFAMPSWPLKLRRARWSRATPSPAASRSTDGLAALPWSRTSLKIRLARPQRYVGSYDQEPLYYIQTDPFAYPRSRSRSADQLHADTFHPSVKAWFFLTDVAEDEGPFVFVPGSHRMTPQRLAWENEMSIGVAESSDRYSARGSFRIQPGELGQSALQHPEPSPSPLTRWLSPIPSAFSPRASGEAFEAGRDLGLWPPQSLPALGPGSIP